MQKLLKLALLLLMVTSIAASGCNASKKSQCGCPNKKGMVGY